MTTGNTMAMDTAFVLREMGVPLHLIGYKFISEALDILVQQPEAAGQLTKVLYPEVAKRFGTTTSRVERAIRHAIEVAWDRLDWDTIYSYFGNSISPSRGKPTNGEYLVTLADKLRNQSRGATISEAQLDALRMRYLDEMLCAEFPEYRELWEHVHGSM